MGIKLENLYEIFFGKAPTLFKLVACPAGENLIVFVELLYCVVFCFFFFKAITCTPPAGILLGSLASQSR